jgi:hypothetical protein
MSVPPKFDIMTYHTYQTAPKNFRHKKDESTNSKGKGTVTAKIILKKKNKVRGICLLSRFI